MHTKWVQVNVHISSNINFILIKHNFYFPIFPIQFIYKLNLFTSSGQIFFFCFIITATKINRKAIIFYKCLGMYIYVSFYNVQQYIIVIIIKLSIVHMSERAHFSTIIKQTSIFCNNFNFVDFVLVSFAITVI